MSKLTFEHVPLLLKLLRRGQEMSMPKEERDKKTYTVFGGMAMLFIMIPCCIIVGLIAYFMTVAMMEAGGKDQGMLFIIQFISACALIFGLNVMVNEFYFSSDIDYLLPLPIKMHELILAKFIVTYLAESVMEFMIIFSAYVGYIIAIGPTPLGIISGLIGTVTLPIIPLVYCGIFSLLAMYSVQGIRNRKILNFIMAILALALIMGVFFSFTGLEGFSVETYVENLIQGENGFLNLMNIIFYPGYLLVHSAAVGSYSDFMIYIVINLVALAVFMFLANKLYLKGLYSFKSVANSKEHSALKLKACKPKSIFVAYLLKELKVLFRTQAYVSNCIVVNLFWPIIIIIVVMMQKGSNSIDNLIQMYQQGHTLMCTMILIFMIGLSAMTTAANSLASSAFTREGPHIDFIKYIPVSYELQFHVKGLISVIFSMASYILDLVVLQYIVQFRVSDLLVYIVLGLLMIIMMTMLGLILDSNHPKLIWEDELNALRGNLNVFFNMAFSILLTAVICGIGIVLNFEGHVPLKNVYIMYFALIIYIDAKMYGYTLKKVVKNIEHLSS